MHLDLLSPFERWLLRACATAAVVFSALVVLALIGFSIAHSQGQPNSAIFEDSSTGCKYTVYGSGRGLEIVTLRAECRVFVTVESAA